MRPLFLFKKKDLQISYVCYNKCISVFETTQNKSYFGNTISKWEQINDKEEMYGESIF